MNKQPMNDGVEIKDRLEGMERDFEKTVARMAVETGGYALGLFEELAGGFGEHFKLALVPGPTGIGYTCIPVTQHAVQLIKLLRLRPPGREDA